MGHGDMVFSDFCDRVSNNATQVNCQECNDASAGLHMAAVMTVVSKWGQFATDMTRSRADEDLACQKIMGIITGILGTVTGIIAFRAWSDVCYDPIPDHFTVTTNDGSTE